MNKYTEARVSVQELKQNKINIVTLNSSNQSPTNRITKSTSKRSFSFLVCNPDDSMEKCLINMLDDAEGPVNVPADCIGERKSNYIQVLGYLLYMNGIISSFADSS